MHFLTQWVLTVLLLLPLCGAVAVGVLRRRSSVVRRLAFGTTVATCAVSLLVVVPFRWRQMLNYDEGPGGSIKLSQKVPLAAAGADYHVGLDGLAMPFVILMTILFALLSAAVWNDSSKGTAYSITLLLLEFAVLGIFVCLDLFSLTVLMAISAAAAIVLAGLSAPDKGVLRATSIYFAISVLCLVTAVFALRPSLGSFDMAGNAHPFGMGAPSWALILLTVGLLVRTAAMPFHWWLVSFVSEAGSSSAIVMNCVLPATGAYGLMRVAMTLLPDAGRVSTTIAVIGVIGFFTGGLCAMAANGLRNFVSYSTSAMMGCVLFAIALRNATALDGAVMLLLGHSLVSAVMLLLAELAPPSPANDRVPVWNAFFGLAWVAWIVGPVLGGQVVIVLGGFESARVGTGVGYGLAVASIFGLLVNAIAAAQVARRTFLPVASAPTELQRKELSPVNFTVLAVLCGVALLLGLLPGILCYTFTHPAARAILHAD